MILSLFIVIGVLALMFKLTGFVFGIFGKLFGLLFSILGYIVLGVIAVLVLGIAFYIIPVILIAGIASIFKALII